MEENGDNSSTIPASESSNDPLTESTFQQVVVIHYSEAKSAAFSGLPDIQVQVHEAVA